jgi:hypothetical protein
MENHDRAAVGRPPYSLAEAKSELTLPLAGLAVILALAFWLP